MARAKTIDYPIRRRWSGEIMFTAKIVADDSTPAGVKIGLAVKWAIQTGADLAYADLARADLARAGLMHANLAGVDLAYASLTGANLARANLTRADLVGADLAGADLAGANLAYASFTDADLTDADLAGASLAGADLVRANLAGAKLPEEALRPFRADLWLTLTEARDPNEVRFLIAALKAGAVEGLTYGDGKSCACLVGTLARFKGDGGETRDHDSDRPAERWFLMIRPGDAPGKVDADGKETSGGFAARKALEWALAWCEAVGLDPALPEAVAVPRIEPAEVAR